MISTLILYKLLYIFICIYVAAALLQEDLIPLLSWMPLKRPAPLSDAVFNPPGCALQAKVTMISLWHTLLLHVANNRLSTWLTLFSDLLMILFVWTLYRGLSPSANILLILKIRWCVCVSNRRLVCYFWVMHAQRIERTLPSSRHPHSEAHQLWSAVTFIRMPVPKTVCKANSYNKWRKYDVCRPSLGRGMGMIDTAQFTWQIHV